MATRLDARSRHCIFVDIYNGPGLYVALQHGVTSVWTIDE